MDTLTLDNLVNAFHEAHTKGLQKGSDTDWSFRECEVHNAAHKVLDVRLDEAKEQARAKEASEGCGDCDGSGMVEDPQHGQGSKCGGCRS